MGTWGVTSPRGGRGRPRRSCGTRPEPPPRRRRVLREDHSLSNDGDRPCRSSQAAPGSSRRHDRGIPGIRDRTARRQPAHLRTGRRNEPAPPRSLRRPRLLDRTRRGRRLLQRVPPAGRRGTVDPGPDRRIMAAVPRCRAVHPRSLVRQGIRPRGRGRRPAFGTAPRNDQWVGPCSPSTIGSTGPLRSFRPSARRRGTSGGRASRGYPHRLSGPAVLQPAGPPAPAGARTCAGGNGFHRAESAESPRWLRSGGPPGVPASASRFPQSAGSRGSRGSPGSGGSPGGPAGPPGRGTAQEPAQPLTLTAFQAAATCWYSTLVDPYRSAVACRVAVRAPA